MVRSEDSVTEFTVKSIRPLREVQQAYIQWAVTYLVRQHGNDKDKIAQALGVSRRTLYHWMKDRNLSLRVDK
jgi:transcriptional regulator with PAS, ATPase and Fis domain